METISTELESKLISCFETYVQHSSDLFDNEEWRECDAFIAGFLLAEKLLKSKEKKHENSTRTNTK